MQTLKKIISRYMQIITLILMTIILVIIVYLQIRIEHKRAYEVSIRTFSQIEQVLDENHKELTEIREKYRQTCLHNAEAIALIIENQPDILYSVEALKEIAEIMEVDEIHIFDNTGRIFAGTHPEYYDYTFDSGEQMMFFKPMLKDKSLQLVQDITPNTAEGKIMQYSALWSRNGEVIVQVGMEPVSVMKVTQKNELSYIFSLFRVNTDATYYAIDAESGEIVGSTNLESTGKSLDDIGLSFDDIADNENIFHTRINGQNSYCVFKKVNDKYLGRVISDRELYQRIPATVIELAICLATIAFILSYAVTMYMNKYVVEGIHSLNEKLYLIAKGNLDETIDIQSSLEFSELSNYINLMIKSLLTNDRKMSYVLSKTNMYISVYEYNNCMETVRFTEYFPKIFSLDPDEAERLSSDRTKFKQFIDRILQNPVPDETGVFRLNEQSEHYIRLEEIIEDQEIFGVAIDVTDEIVRRKKIELERDIDSLTGLYNRRGLDSQLSVLFEKPEELGCSAFVMIDADDLKMINDTYGHEKGDVYLKQIAGILSNFGSKSSVVARQSGDEFVLFLYQYDNEEELINTLKNFEYIQNHSSAHLDHEITVPLRFSFGYSLTGKNADYQNLIKQADKKMYENKRERKAADLTSQSI